MIGLGGRDRHLDDRPIDGNERPRKGTFPVWFLGGEDDPETLEKALDPIVGAGYPFPPVRKPTFVGLSNRTSRELLIPQPRQDPTRGVAQPGRAHGSGP